jgi:hypothetical protein
MGIKIEKHSILEIDENFNHHLRAWRIKRVGWILILLILIVAFAGYLGPGPFSKTTLQGRAGLGLKYERISRYNAPAHFLINVPANKDQLELSINNSFLEKIDIERIDPEPAEMRLAGDKHTWVFANAQTNSPSQIRISFRPESFGSAHAHFQFAGLGSIEIKPFFLP